MSSPKMCEKTKLRTNRSMFYIFMMFYMSEDTELSMSDTVCGKEFLTPTNSGHAVRHCPIGVPKPLQPDPSRHRSGGPTGNREPGTRRRLPPVRAGLLPDRRDDGPSTSAGCLDESRTRRPHAIGGWRTSHKEEVQTLQCPSVPMHGLNGSKEIRLHPPSIRLIRKERLHDSMSSVSVSQPRLPSRRSTRRASRPHSPPERPVEGPGDWAVTGRRAADSSQTENPDGELQDKMVLGGSRSHPT